MTKLGVATVTLGLIILGWATSLAAAAGALVFTGLAGAAVWITAPGLAAQAAPESRRGTAIGLVGTGIGIGIVFAGLAAGAIESSQWRVVYQTEAFIGVLVTIVAVNRTRRGEHRALPSFRDLHSIFHNKAAKTRSLQL